MDQDQKKEKVHFVEAFHHYVHEFKTKAKIAKLQKQVSQIEAIQKTRYADLSNEELAHQTEVLKSLYEQNGKKKTEELVNSAFAVVLESVRRTKGNIQLTSSQIMASLVLNEGLVAELATGEGKTYALTMSVYLNAICGEQVHVYTANDYLAERDSIDTKPIFESLGLKVGCALPDYTENGQKIGMTESRKKRKEIYSSCDIVYAQPSTIVFDYLRDKRALSVEDLTLTRPFGSAVIDEVDSVMIDNASTPFILSENEKDILEERNAFFQGEAGRSAREISFLTAFGQRVVNLLTQDPAKVYENSREVRKTLFKEFMDQYSTTVNSLEKDIENSGAFILYDKKEHSVSLTDKGYEQFLEEFQIMREFLSSPDSIVKIENFSEEEAWGYVLNALKANFLMKEGRDYLIQGSGHQRSIELIDANTGRPLPDNKYSEGLQQAIEAKERIFGSKQTKQTITTARTTQPTFFAKYSTVVGTTGTANDETTKQEFQDQYHLGVLKVPSARPKIAVEQPTEVYATRQEKISQIVKQIQTCYARQQPILVGAADVNEAVEISRSLQGLVQKDFSEIYQFFFPGQEYRTNQCMKLYCYLTDTPLPARGDIEAKLEIANMIEALTLPEEKRTQEQAELKEIAMSTIRSTPSLSEESLSGLYRFKFKSANPSPEILKVFSMEVCGVPNELLTAENIEEEARVISKAGRLGAVTISTAIAGRGTDIKIGGDPVDLTNQEMSELTKAHPNLPQEYLDEMRSRCLEKWKHTCKREKEMILGDHPEKHVEGKGLYVLGASINTSIRIDNQLRGRCGRQGSDGESKFFCSLEDPLFVRYSDKKTLQVMRELVKKNPRQPRVYKFVRATQKCAESLLETSRIFQHECEYGIDKISNLFYNFRDKLLKEPDDYIVRMKKSPETLFKRKKKVVRAELQSLVPLVYTEEELQELSPEELEERLSQKLKDAVDILQKLEPQERADVSKDLLKVNDLLLVDAFDDLSTVSSDVNFYQIGNHDLERKDIMDRIFMDKYDRFGKSLFVQDSLLMIRSAEKYRNVVMEREEKMKEEEEEILDFDREEVAVSPQRLPQEETTIHSENVPPSSVLTQGEDTPPSFSSSQPHTPSVIVNLNDKNWSDAVIEQLEAMGDNEESEEMSVGRGRR